MKLYEIIDTVDTLIPNTLLAEEKIKWINEIQNNLFRDYPIPESIHSAVIQPGQKFIPLPADCAEDRITEVVVNSVNYPFLPRSSDGDAPPVFCTFISGTLMIYPALDAQGIAYIYYGPRPITLSTETMDTEPTFPKDFHNLLVYGCLELVALSKPDTLNLSGVYAGKYQTLAEKADLTLRRKRPNRTIIVRPWS